MIPPFIKNTKPLMLMSYLKQKFGKGKTNCLFRQLAVSRKSNFFYGNILAEITAESLLVVHQRRLRKEGPAACSRRNKPMPSDSRVQRKVHATSLPKFCSEECIARKQATWAHDTRRPARWLARLLPFLKKADFQELGQKLFSFPECSAFQPS